ncbi:MAG: SDR family NAD(P)-dependent oxidoreductase [Thermoanaerobaculia bacterium]
MQRIVVVTGAASGIGAATASHLRELGIRVIGADLRDADVVADLTTAAGRAALVEGVGRLSDGRIDGIVANAGGGPVETSVQLNYFGAVATVEGLRPFLRLSPDPRAVAVSSIGSLFAFREDLVEACLSGDEERAIAIARTVRNEAEASGADAHRVRETVYGHAKQALNRWCRSSAANPDWAGEGIPLNVVALGVYDTPAASFILGTRRGVGRSRTTPRSRAHSPAGPATPLLCSRGWSPPKTASSPGRFSSPTADSKCRLRGGLAPAPEPARVGSNNEPAWIVAQRKELFPDRDRRNHTDPCAEARPGSGNIKGTSTPRRRS